MLLIAAKGKAVCALQIEVEDSPTYWFLQGSTLDLIIPSMYYRDSVDCVDIIV